MKRLGEVKPIDFLLYIGEESLNEPAFEYLNQQTDSEVQSRISQFISPDANIYTCTIGLKSTSANYYLEQAEINFELKKLKIEPV